MIEFSLTAFELQYLILVAERVTVVKSACNVRNQRCQNKSDLATHLTGVLGEYAVAKLLGTKLDTNVYIGGDGGTDLVVDGYTIQVKTRNHQPEPIYLYVNKPEDLRSDIIVLAQAPTLTEVRVWGWLLKEEFLAASKPLSFGYGGRIGVASNQLRTPETLREWLSSNSKVAAADW